MCHTCYEIVHVFAGGYPHFISFFEGGDNSFADAFYENSHLISVCCLDRLSPEAGAKLAPMLDYVFRELDRLDEDENCGFSESSFFSDLRKVLRCGDEPLRSELLGLVSSLVEEVDRYREVESSSMLLK
jgi:hypothetical protein